MIAGAMSPCTTRAPLYWHGLTLILTWISNYIHYKVQDEIAYPFPNFNHWLHGWNLGIDK